MPRLSDYALLWSTIYPKSSIFNARNHRKGLHINSTSIKKKVIGKGTCFQSWTHRCHVLTCRCFSETSSVGHVGSGFLSATLRQPYDEALANQAEYVTSRLFRPLGQPPKLCDDFWSLHVISICKKRSNRKGGGRPVQALPIELHPGCNGVLPGSFAQPTGRAVKNSSASKFQAFCQDLEKNNSIKQQWTEKNEKSRWKLSCFEGLTSISGSPIQYQSRNHSSAVSAHIILDVAKSSLVFLDTMVFWEGGVKQLHLGDFIFVVDYHVADVTLTSRRLRFVCVYFYVFATLLTFHEFMLRCCYGSAFLSKWVVCGYNYIHTQSYIYYEFIYRQFEFTWQYIRQSHVFIYIYMYHNIYIYIRNYRYIYTGARTCFTRFDQNHRKELKNTSGWRRDGTVSSVCYSVINGYYGKYYF